MTDCTINLVRLALDAALMRHTAIASNIAHVNTKNYQNITVDFEKQLHETTENSLEEIKPEYTVDATAISVDEQMAASVKNATHYKALIKGLNHHLALMKLAVQGNNT